MVGSLYIEKTDKIEKINESFKPCFRWLAPYTGKAEFNYIIKE